MADLSTSEWVGSITGAGVSILGGIAAILRLSSRLGASEEEIADLKSKLSTSEERAAARLKEAEEKIKALEAHLQPSELQSKLRLIIRDEVQAPIDLLRENIAEIRKDQAVHEARMSSGPATRRRGS